MGFGFVERHQFANGVTDAFSKENIAATVTRLGTPADHWDHLDILQRLQLLPFVPEGKLDAYRERLGIPKLHQAVITQALRHGLAAKPPVPVVFHVINGATEGVTVTSGSGTIYVTVIREGYDGSTR